MYIFNQKKKNIIKGLQFFLEKKTNFIINCSMMLSFLLRFYKIPNIIKRTDVVPIY